MPEPVLITELEFRKGQATFLADGRIDAIPVPAAEEALAEAVANHHCRAVIVGVTPYRGPLYEALAETGRSASAIIARFGVGHDSVDKALARRHGVIVTNTPGVLDQSVAEHAVWLMGALARNLAAADARLRAGEFASPCGVELGGKTLGILGCGAIGRRVAQIAHFGLGMRVTAAESRSVEELQRAGGRAIEELLAAWGIEALTPDVERMLGEADVLSIHLPANDQTRHFIAAERLAAMRPDAMLVNTARGSVLDEVALYDALAGGRLAGAALDVFNVEPYAPAIEGKDLRTLANVVLTPHVGSNTHEANRRMAEACLENLVHFFSGRHDRLTPVVEEG